MAIAIEWFLLALPLVFLLGWFSARLDIRDIRKSGRELPHAYLKGLSHLLRDQKKRALDAFLRAQPLDPQSAELQFAIGDLSRRRGEYRRALEVHQQLCEREDLSAADRKRALWELAGDYFQMGFLDVAEKHAAMIKDDDYRERVGGMLLEIRQRACDYSGALDVLDNMSKEASLMRRTTRAHLLCECASRKTVVDEKRQLLEAALVAYSNCARAGIMLGDMSVAEQNYESAVARYTAVEGQNSRYLWCAVEGAMAAYESQQKITAGIDEMLRWLQHYPSSLLFEAVYQAMAARGMEANLAGDNLKHGLGLAAAAAWSGEKEQQAVGDERDLWRALTQAVTLKRRYRCENCGYETGNFAWQCHNCLSWESFQSGEMHG